MGRAVEGKDGQAIDENLAKQLMRQELKYKTKPGVFLKAPILSILKATRIESTIIC